MRKMAGWVLLSAISCGVAIGRPIDGITFSIAPGKLYLDLDEANRELQLPLQRDKSGVALNSMRLEAEALRSLIDGTLLIPMEELERVGAKLAADEQGHVLVFTDKGSLTVLSGAKRVEVSLSKQQLRAWQGERLVLMSHISSGRRGSTPPGDFQAGPYKARRHYSSRYQNAPMPWSVQVHGHVFIHGFTSVPDRPASHGCIRLPLTGGNPARFFYEWIDLGTPVKVIRS